MMILCARESIIVNIENKGLGIITMENKRFNFLGGELNLLFDFCFADEKSLIDSGFSLIGFSYRCVGIYMLNCP